MSSTKSPIEIRENFRQFLVSATNCGVQVGADNREWPCGTCVFGLLNELGLDCASAEYQERNSEHDRHNEVWRAILQIREADLTE